MFRLLPGVAVLAATLAFATSAVAEPIFVDDFQDGAADGWAATGDGDVRLTTYQDNISLRFTRRAEAVTSVSIRGFGTVVVAASLAGRSLGRGDVCVAEVSTDAGGSWQTIVRLDDGADDGITLVRGEIAPDGGRDNDRLMIRFRAVGGLTTQCWGDAVTVTGEALAAGAEARGTVDAVLSGASFSAPVDLSGFVAPGDAEPSLERAAWRLTLDVARAEVTLDVLRDETGDGPAEKVARSTLPVFDFDFVQDGGRLIPVRRGVVISDHSAWDWVIEPGRVWIDDLNPGWLRAALPFALQERNANCVHNGVLTFRFKPDGSTSAVVFEIASETCAYFKFDAWGQVPAHLEAAPETDADRAVAAYEVELAARLPMRPLAELEQLHPGIDASRLALAAPVDGDPPTAYGLVLGGVHYVGGCQTRHGAYPFCEVLDLPSYSTAKSIVGGVGLMRLAALSPGATEAQVRDHVPACAVGRTWDGVTLVQTLDMATGVYGSTAFEVDENAPSMSTFFDAPDHATKIAEACGQHGRGAPPGRTFVYHTTDTYLLGTAMADIAQARGAADFYDDLIVPLWRSLELSPTILQTRRTADAVRQPFTGWGLTYHADDIVRIAGWLANGARIEGRAMLDEGLLSAALQREPTPSGLPAGIPGFRYKAGFWARDIAPALGCSAPLLAPFMSGYGGISVVLLPGGVTFYYFGDSGVFDWAPAAVELAKIKRICP